MAKAIPSEKRASTASYTRVGPDLAQQVAILADQPADGVLWSDVFDHLQDGFLAARRLLTTKFAHAPR